jgi:hypothetical protein
MDQERIAVMKYPLYGCTITVLLQFVLSGFYQNMR